MIVKLDSTPTMRHRYRLSAAEAAEAGHETSLSLEMGPATYVHTRRFVLELQAFARDFSLLRRVIAQARKKVSAVCKCYHWFGETNVFGLLPNTVSRHRNNMQQCACVSNSLIDIHKIVY